jgi:transposase
MLYYERHFEVALMMDHQKPLQPSLFYKFNLDQRVRADHPLRIIAGLMDFDFIYEEVEEFYGTVGKPSIPPPVILKLMFLLAYENVSSERQLLATLPLRLDWLWFLGMDLDSDIPDHSVLSKARTRWGTEAFRSFFQRVIQQANESGLIDGRRIFCDGSLFDAMSSNKNSTATREATIQRKKNRKERFEFSAARRPTQRRPSSPNLEQGRLALATRLIARWMITVA